MWSPVVPGCRVAGWRPIAVAGALCLAVAVGGCRDDSPLAPDITAAPAVAAATTFLLTDVSAGLAHSCGIAPDQRAYCWGINDQGQLGDGTTTDRSRPVLVAGGLHFTQISAAERHTCGLTGDSLVYCWGLNIDGQLGNGLHLRRLAPVLVRGGRKYLMVTTGGFFSCAIASTNRAFCWGSNSRGQLGTGTTTSSAVPVAVTGGLHFRRIVGGGQHTCAVTLADKGYCWGDSDFGKLGYGPVTGDRHAPTAIAGGLSFRQVTAGGAHTCGVTPGNKAYCWGDNQDGALGDGTRTQRTSPRAVAGGLSFSKAVAAAHVLLRRNHRQRGLLLGRQFRRPARRRHPDGPAHPDPGRRRHRVQRRGAGRVPHLRRDQLEARLVLGAERLRAAGRRHQHRAGELLLHPLQHQA